MNIPDTTLPHPHSERWQPYRDPDTGEAVTITWQQVQAVHHAVRIVDDLRRVVGGRPLRDDLFGAKSRALGRLLVDGKPLFEDCPPHACGGANYGLWDDDNDVRAAS